LLAAPSTPPAAREEALSLAQEGQKVSPSKAKEIISKHRKNAQEGGYTKVYADPQIYVKMLDDAESIAKIEQIIEGYKLRDLSRSVYVAPQNASIIIEAIARARSRIQQRDEQKKQQILAKLEEVQKGRWKLLCEAEKLVVAKGQKKDERAKNKAYRDDIRRFYEDEYEQAVFELAGDSDAVQEVRDRIEAPHVFAKNAPVEASDDAAESQPRVNDSSTAPASSSPGKAGSVTKELQKPSTGAGDSITELWNKATLYFTVKLYPAKSGNYRQAMLRMHYGGGEHKVIMLQAHQVQDEHGNIVIPRQYIKELVEELPERMAEVESRKKSSGHRDTKLFDEIMKLLPD
ncbi:MAG: hypothetical protein LC731_09000, partial [Acidobacteria bacterium]|nr:hypothetical protein [Acidobacteriota bacterium]